MTAKAGLYFIQQVMSQYLFGKTVKAMLVTSDYEFNTEAHSLSDFASYEPVDNGTTVIFGSYEAGGMEQDTSTDIAYGEGKFNFNGNSFTLTGATLPDVGGVVWYVAETELIIAVDMFETPVAVDGSWTYTIPDEVYLQYVLPESGAAPVTVNFLGDPGDGEYAIGWALGPGNNNLTEMRANPGYPTDAEVSVIHDYSDNTSGLDTMRLDRAINAGFIPSQSFKMKAYTMAQIASGAADAAIDAIAQVCLDRDPWPIWLCIYHEPEDNFTTGPSQVTFRAASRRVVTRVRDAGVTNVAWQPIYMNPWTFSDSSGRDWRNWHPDWDGAGWHDDLLMSMFGADTYNPLPGNTTSYSFEELWASLKEKVEIAGAPVWDYTMPEFGMSYNADPTPDWEDWCAEAQDFMKANRIKSACYWDNSVFPVGHPQAGQANGRYSFGSTYDPSGNKAAGWQIIIDGSVKVTP